MTMDKWIQNVNQYIIVLISMNTLVSDMGHLFTGWGDIPKDK